MKDKFFIKGLPLNAPTSYLYDEKLDWAQNILNELTEELNKEERKSYSESFSADIEITRKSNGSLGEFVILSGSIQIKYPVHDVKTFEMMQEVQETEVNAIVLDKNLEKTLELEDETTYYLDVDEELDLYFYDRKLDIAPILHEYVFLNKNPYPTMSPSEEVPFIEEDDL